MRSHLTWCLVVALNALVLGSKPRQIVYQIRPAPLSAYNSHDGTFLLDDGVTEFQFPTFGLKTAAETRTVKAYAPPPSPSLPVVTSLTSAANDSADVDSSAGASSSTGLSGENSSAAVTREEITEVPRFGSSQVRQQYLTLQPEQFQQIFQQVPPQQQYYQQIQPQQQFFQIQPQQQQQQQQQVVQQAPQTVDVGPQYEYKSMEDPNTSNGEVIKTAQTEVITEDRLQPAYSERREKRRRKDKEQEQPPGDASYAFGYETDEAARHEVADPDGNVKGWYTYVDDEGTVRKIIYTAGAGKGFVILGKEKVRGPGAAAPPQQRKHKSSSRKGNSDYGYSADSSTYSSTKSQKGASTPPSLTNYFNNFNDLAKAGTSNPPQPTTIVATNDQPTRTKKPVFIVKIKRPVKGQYPEGTKRTVHYIAGGNTGFQVIHASPSITRGVRLEAPPGYVVKRVPSLRTSESRFPIPISVPQPSAIVYHIHPDGGWKPWEPTLRKKKIKIHRKKLPKSFFENAQRDGIVLLQTHPDNVPISRSSSPSVTVNNVGSSSTNAYFKEKVTAAGSGQVTATETRYPGISVSAPVSRRRHAPQRGYTAEHHLVQIDDSDSKEQIHPRQYLSPQLTSKSSSPSSSSMSTSTQSATTAQAVHEREPLLYSPTFETVRDRMPIPNPIQLLPTQVAVKNKGAPMQSAQPGLDTSSSNHHAVAFTSDGKLQVDVPTVVIEAIEANSPSSLVTTIKKDENKNAAPHTHTVLIHHRLPEPAALTQSTPSPPPQQVVVTKTSSSSSSNPNTIITVIQPTTRPNYEISSASASSTGYGYKYHHLQNHHYKPNPVTVPTASPTPIHAQASPTTIVVHKQQSARPAANQLSSGGNIPPSSPTPPPTRSRRRHHRSKTVTTLAPTSPSAPPSPSPSASNYSSNAIRAGGGGADGGSNSGGNTETTTMMSSSKRLINRLAAPDNDLAVSA